VQAQNSTSDSGSFKYVDKPKTNMRIVTLLVWGVSCFLGFKAVTEPPSDRWVLPLVLGFFVLCSSLLVGEFMLRPTRTTCYDPVQRKLVIQETARWRKKEQVASISPSERFQVFHCDSDPSVLVYGVRIRSTDNDWLTIADYLPKERAEDLARQANRFQS
jgi:hypothetical protein